MTTYIFVALVGTACTDEIQLGPAIGATPEAVSESLMPASRPGAGSAKGTSQNAVTVAPDIFDQQGEKYDESLGEGWFISPEFLVLSKDLEKTVAALKRASSRFYSIDEYGRELTTEERHKEIESAKTWDIPYTPNYVSDIYLTDLGPVVWTDTKGGLPKPMGSAMLRVLVAELERQGVAAHVTAPPADLSLEGVPVIRLEG